MSKDCKKCMVNNQVQCLKCARSHGLKVTDVRNVKDVKTNIERRKKIKTRKYNIVENTSIVPVIVADCIVSEVSNYLFKKNKSLMKEFNDNDKIIVEFLVNYQDGIYQNNRDWRNRLKGKDTLGRDTMYTFMRHWLSAWLKKEMPLIYENIPKTFRMGIPLA